MSQRDLRLAEFLLGQLPRRDHTDMERALDDSPDLRRGLADVERTLSQLGLESKPVEPSPELRTRILRSIGSSDRFAGFVPRVARLFDLSIERTREILRRIDHFDREPWEASVARGVRLLHLDGGPRVVSADCGLVHVVPGAGFPRHRHRGDEWAFILQGRGREDTGRIWEPGDLVRAEAGTAHTFVAIGDEPFVFAVLLREGIDILRD